MAVIKREIALENCSLADCEHIVAVLSRNLHHRIAALIRQELHFGRYTVISTTDSCAIVSDAGG